MSGVLLRNGVWVQPSNIGWSGVLGLEGGVSGVLPRNGISVLPRNIGWSGVLPWNRGDLGLEGKGVWGSSKEWGLGSTKEYRVVGCSSK